MTPLGRTRPVRSTDTPKYRRYWRVLAREPESGLRAMRLQCYPRPAGTEPTPLDHRLPPPWDWHRATPQGLGAAAELETRICRQVDRRERRVADAHLIICAFGFGVRSAAWSDED